MWQLFILGLIFVFLWIKNDQNYFEKHKIPYFKSFPLFGIFTRVALRQQSVYENITELYNAPHLKDEPFYGFHLFHQPALLLKDLDLIKRILTTDFNKFPYRFAGSDLHDPLGAHFIFFTKDTERRKIIRPKISKFFSGSNLKFSFDHVQSETLRFIEDLKSSQVDLLETFDPLLVNIVANISLGIDAKNNEHLHHAIKSILEPSFVRNIEFGAFLGFRKIMKYFGLKLFGGLATKFFMRIIPEILNERMESGRSRNDFIDLLIKIKKENEIEDDFIDAQVMMFIGGAYAPCLIAIVFLLYELSKQPHLQTRLRTEIYESLQPHHGHLTYQHLSTTSQMPFLHQVVCEILRLYPVLTMIDRQCVEVNGYSLEPFSNYKIPHGMPIWIPIFAIARDEKFFPNPLKFDPRRFENVENLPPCSFLLSFGAGPKQCLAERFTLMLIKSVVVNVLKEFRVEVNEKTPMEIKFKKDAYVIESEERMIVDFIRDEIKF